MASYDPEKRTAVTRRVVPHRLPPMDPPFNDDSPMKDIDEREGIYKNWSVLVQRIDRLGERVEMLRDRLSPVLAPPHNMAKGDVESTDSKEQSPLASMIDDESFRLTRILEKVDELHILLEL